MLEVTDRTRGEEMTEQSKPVTWDIRVPGRFLDAIAYLDLETRKVPCRWAFPNGVPLGRRWSAFIAGVGTRGHIRIVESAGDERAFLAGVREAIGKADTVLYRATNTFDEGILKGRFTYARRGWADEAFYPAMPDAEELTWDRRKHDPRNRWQSMRERELDSRYVSVTYERDSALVLVHNLRDVVELIGAYGEPDKRCATWCERVLTDADFAYAQVFGPDWDKTPGFAA
jgi:hypothetical protein